MRIDKLIVRKTKPSCEIIREIEFNPKGLSLIIDNTINSNLTNASGNSVGKTTAIKIIDLCLGAKSVRNIYYDQDTKSENEEIKSFLKENKVQAELILTHCDKSFSIKRDLFNNGKRYIGQNQFTEEEFWDELKKMLFDSTDEFPTFRQLISKFVRLSATSEESMIKFLSTNTTNDQYDSIYGYLFKVLDDGLISKKNALAMKLDECKKKIKLLEEDKNISSISVLKQKKEFIDKELNTFHLKRENLSYLEKYKEELENKRSLTSKINILENECQVLDFDIKTINDSLKKLDSEKSNVNLNLLQDIYNEAKRYIPELQKKFEEMVTYHNDMIQNRIDFITEQLKKKNNQLIEINTKVDELLNEKKKITVDILDEGLLDELNIYNRKIEELSIQKGEVMQALNLLESAEHEKDECSNQFRRIENEVNEDYVVSKMDIFNEYFSEYCDRLYGEKYLVTYNTRWKKEKTFPISITAVGNVGTGKKKALIVAFDLAYLKYAEQLNIAAPQFVIHDKLENTYINQLKIIFDICQNINGQYIFPIIRERIDKINSSYIDAAKVLELNTNDKFFKV